MNSESTTTPVQPTESTSAATEKKGHPIVSFVRGLKEREDNGTLAVLRGALSTSHDRQLRAYRVLAPFGGFLPKVKINITPRWCASWPG